MAVYATIGATTYTGPDQIATPEISYDRVRNRHVTAVDRRVTVVQPYVQPHVQPHVQPLRGTADSHPFCGAEQARALYEKNSVDVSVYHSFCAYYPMPEFMKQPTRELKASW